MESFCRTKFWDINLTWNTTSDPDLTSCFQETVLIYVPCSVLWILSLYSLIRLLTNNKGTQFSIPWTFINLTKIIISCILSILSATQMIYSLIKLYNEDGSIYPVDYYTPFIQSITYVYATVLLFVHRRHGNHTSGALFLFWFLQSITASINLRSIVLNITQKGFEYEIIDELVYCIKMASFPLILIQFILSTISERTVNDLMPNPEKINSWPESSISFLSYLTFWWFNEIIIKGYKKPLTSSDMWTLDKNNKSEELVEKFEKIWLPRVENAKKRNKDNSGSGVLIPLIKTFWPDFLLSAILKLISSLLIFVNPIVLDWLITFITNSNEPSWKGFLYASLMFISPMIESIITNHYSYTVASIGMRAKSCLICLIYKKGLRLSSMGKKDFTTGEVINLIAIDTEWIRRYLVVAHLIWSIPFQIGIALYLLWAQLGISVLAGIAVMILTFPINTYGSSKLKNIQVTVMKEKDQRIRIMNEILNGIKVLKLYAWENSFKDYVMNFRSKEIKCLRKQAWINSGLTLIANITPFLIGLSCFATYILIDTNNILDANKAFVSLSLLNLLIFPLEFLPVIVAYGALFMVSLKRINKYLRADENAISKDSNMKVPVRIDRGTFKWTKDDYPVLNNITLKVNKNKLVAVVGQVGSGKSSLLSALLGDMVKTNGKVYVNGSIAYVSQQAWIQNAKLRQNILFTSEMNDAKYKETIEACALKPDFKMLPAGDETEIGEKGINLSGGQKQRVSLARAVYQNSDIYLLDDPLSAVDAHVGRHLFDHVIGPKGMLKDKTRILVTHRLSILPQVDEIIVIKDGVISEHGSYEELIERKGDFAQLLAEHLVEENGESIIDSQEIEIIEQMVESVKPLLERTISRKSSGSDVGGSDAIIRKISSARKRTMSSISSVSSSTTVIENRKSKEESKEQKRGEKLIEAETSETGQVKPHVYWQYIQSIGLYSTLIALTSYIVSNAFQIGVSLWLSEWSDDSLDSIKRNDTALRDLRLGVYAGLGIGEAVTFLLSTITLSLACLNASKLLHNSMLKHIIKSPMSFFDTTPIGRILNRFSKDIDTADNVLIELVRSFVSLFLRAIATFTMIIFVNGLIVIAIIPLMILYYYILKVYIATSRQLNRIDSTSRSPIYNHFSETISGVASIRAFGVSKKFIKESNERVDYNIMHYYPGVVATRWLFMRIEFFGYTIVFLTAIFAILSKNTLSPGLVGLSITYAMNITGILRNLVNATSQLETNIVSVERCLEYTNTPTEADWHIESNAPNISWPENGRISFKNYSTRYRDGLDLILKRINLEVNSNEKIGVVGRTGAGKSSLTLALFRLIEPVEGTIHIDDINVGEIGLYDLRSKLTIIPQDPMLFTGTLRMNLDPFDMYSDMELWKSLELAHLKSFVGSLEKGLQHELTEGGDNLSVGQKQLVCLARALLRKSKILVLDEATAAVDLETDDLIQETIRREFKDCTIMTIAHRLNTIIDYDKVVVLDKGEIAEFDTPSALLENTSSIFYSMAKEAGLV